MTPDDSIALSLDPTLHRVGLAERLRADDPRLLEQARAQRPRLAAARRLASVAGAEAVAWTDPRYPRALLTTPDHPPALWWRGDPAVAHLPAVAIVGSRAASAGALEMAAQLAADLAARGIVVVSGLARGVDSAAHRGALDEGRTIAVLGSGIDRMYPAEHARLADAIAVAGLVVTEHPPGTPPLKRHFPLRNRIISGLSRAVVVVEAAAGSGSLITAAAALEQGREVMAVPGSALGGRNRGAHALIRDGAKIVEGADDIVEELGLGDPGGAWEGSSHGESVACDDSLLAAMTPGAPCEIEALVEASGLPVARLLPRLMDLELRGRIRRLDGGRFMRPRRTC